jgi:hypothetical protein
MRTITANCLPGSLKKRNLTVFSLFGTLLLVFFSANLFAQTVSFPTSCTSKDLTLLQASLPAPSGNRCACSGDRSLILGIHNGTGSTRTSFALWGTLIRKDAAGVVISTDQIFACAGPISPSGDYFLNATTIKINGVDVPVGSVVTSSGTLTLPIIHIECGQSLDIVDMHLAWTAATPGSTCASLYNSPGTINPKCGIQDLIRVDLGVDGNLTTTAATCTIGGKIRVTPFGGIGPYEVSLDGNTYQPVPANPGYYEFTGVTAGAHTVTIRDNTSKPLAERCSTSKTPTVGSSTAPTSQAAGDLITCSHTTGALTGSGSSTGANITYLWSGPGSITNSNSISASATTNGTYTLKVTNTDNGCTASASASVSVNTSAPTVQAAGDLITCSHTTATLSGSGSSTGAGISYLWTGAGTVTNSNLISATTITAGSYTLKVTDGGNGCTASASASVSVNTSAPSFTVCLIQPTLCDNTLGKVTVHATNGTSFTYKLNGGTAQSSNVFSGLGGGSVSNITVIGQNGCSTTVNCSSLQIDCTPGLITQKENPVNNALTVPESGPAVKAYPNPFNDRVKFVINSPNAGNGSLEIYNVMGQKVKTVYQGHINTGDQSFELTIPKKQQQTLIYMLMVDGKKVTGKLLQLNN